MTQQYESTSPQQISDLVQLTVRLARSIRKSDPALYGVAVDFLKRNSLLGSLLRDDESACPTDVCEAASSDGVLCAEGDCDQSSGVRPPMRHIPGVREDVLERAAKAWSNSVVEVRGLYYKNVNVPLTGYRFVDCRFDNCTFSGTAEGRQFELCIFDRGLVADAPTELPGWPQVELAPYQILSIERRSSMTDDEALRFGRAVESRILANMKIRPNPPGVAVSDTLPLEKALHELVDKIVPGLDTGDLVQDARQASAALDSVMVSAPVAGYIAGIDAFRTGVGETSATFKTTAFGAPVADERAVLQKLVDLEDMRLRLRALHESGHGTDYGYYHKALPAAWEAARAALASAPVAGEARRPELTVWYGSMPESNGKSNWTAILHRKDDGLGGGVNITIDRSEYPDRVRYEADRVRFLIGEIDKEPWILDYDADKCDAPPAAEPPSALQRYTEFMANDSEKSPIERLRFFCSLAMNGQDWLDSEPFFEALQN